MIKPKNELSPKHLKALELIRLGDKSYREIAREVGLSDNMLYDLIAGDTAKCGSAASLFAVEVDRIMAEKTKEIRALTKATQKNLFSVFHEYSNVIKNRKPDKETLGIAVSITNAIGKVTPNVEIGNFSYTKGLSAEDLVNEFRRLKGLAANGNGVLPAFQGKSREIPGVEEPGSSS
jgi:hypothetical protein